VLKKDGYEVLSADNGAEGLALVRKHKPDLVISDIQMPVMDGFAMLQILRGDPAIEAIPVILLTSLLERAHMRIGMTSGADDYITKPFRPGELREAASAQLNRREMRAKAQAAAVEVAVTSALEVQKHQLARLYERRMAAKLSDKWTSADASNDDERFDSATVLFVDVLNYSTLAESLSTQELSETVRKFYSNAGDTVHLFGARHMQFVGEALVAVFVQDTDTMSVNHGLRAARAAIGLVDAAKRVQNYLEAQYPERQLPIFQVSIGLHSGAVSLAKLQDPLHGEVHILPVGDAVNLTLLLQKQAPKSGWTIVASIPMLPGRTQPVDAVELLSLES
jgi:CheY-like chemotaxis protein